MRSQSPWFRSVVCVVTLTATLFSFTAIKSFAQASLFDSTFAAGGGANGSVYAILIQEDGKIVVGGEFTHIAGQACTNLARLHSDGQLDTSFPDGTDGPVYGLLKQPDGRILVSGAFLNLQGVVRQSIGRLLTNGAVDISFDAGANISSALAAFAMTVQPDGKVLASAFDPLSSSNAFLKRFEPNGHLDNTFIQTNIFDSRYVFAICPRTDGSILIGGSFQQVNGFPIRGLALITTNGLLNTNFISGIQTNHIFQASIISSLVRQTDGGVLVGGSFWRQSSTNRMVLARLTPALAWDESFAVDAFDQSDPSAQYPHIRSVRIQTDGKILVGGNFYEVGGYWRRHVLRLDTFGHVDPCFDPGIGLGGFDGTYAIDQQVDGKILVGGKFSDEYSYTNLTRLLPTSDCNATRVHLGRYGPDQYYVAATCAPGGTNYLQLSTNLVDWISLNQFPYPSTSPYIYFPLGSISTLESGAFFRVKKEY